MIIYNNNYPALFNQEDTEEFLDSVKKLANEALENMNRGKINYRSFTWEKYNKFQLAIDSGYFDYEKLNDIVGIEYNANFSFIKVQEVAKNFELNESFSKSNKKLMEDIHKDLNASLIRDNSDLPFTDTIKSSEIKKMIKMNSDRVRFVLTKIFSFNEKVLNLIKLSNNKISIDNINNFIDVFMNEKGISEYIEEDLISEDIDNIDDSEFGFKISFNNIHSLEEQLRIIDTINEFYKAYTNNKNNENYVAISYDKEPLERLFDFC